MSVNLVSLTLSAIFLIRFEVNKRVSKLCVNKKKVANTKINCFGCEVLQPWYVEKPCQFSNHKFQVTFINVQVINNSKLL